ncbi:hypothetical protein DPMN_191725 [Dreissena polymorpha]|uniref:Uncharacterized protein n=1 Tax=Dreissena polymorpha TaxID=45954 RepID=A0A9D3Y123_DREPO|nr:hypothetical protein DPMN_191725 [Dreissena polymorpha]
MFYIEYYPCAVQGDQGNVESKNDDDDDDEDDDDDDDEDDDDDDDDDVLYISYIQLVLTEY